ncbi:MAG: J domain-containing protein [Actinobacteria bacterium]|nr:MAG: J domain-containing protein [Actinomycetota bacterium]
MASEPGNGERMYRRLQVTPEATAQQIRRAYRRLAHDVHPDANPEDPQASRRFQEITEAYEILSSPERRAVYDQARQYTGTTRANLVRLASAETSRAADRIAAGWPTVIGAPVFPIGSPLVAGPVRTVPARNPPDPYAVGGELSRLIEAISAWWRSY